MQRHPGKGREADGSWGGPWKGVETHESGEVQERLMRLMEGGRSRERE